MEARERGKGRVRASTRAGMESLGRADETKLMSNSGDAAGCDKKCGVRQILLGRVESTCRPHARESPTIDASSHVHGT